LLNADLRRSFILSFVLTSFNGLSPVLLPPAGGNELMPKHGLDLFATAESFLGAGSEQSQ
jgi:hypothetical protein